MSVPPPPPTPQSLSAKKQEYSQLRLPSLVPIEEATAFNEITQTICPFDSKIQKNWRMYLLWKACYQLRLDPKKSTIDEINLNRLMFGWQDLGEKGNATKLLISIRGCLNTTFTLP